jgi:hypothetical protein
VRRRTRTKDEDEDDWGNTMDTVTITIHGNFRSAEIARDVQEACAETANEMGALTALRAAKGTPMADEQRIRSLPERDWWPKLVAKKLRKVKSVAAGQTAAGKPRFFTRAEARAFSKSMVRRRLARRGRTRAGWSRPAQVLPHDGREHVDFGSGNFQERGEATPARPGPEAVCVIENNAPGADRIGQRALDRALQETEKDAPEIAAKHLEKRLKKYG